MFRQAQVLITGGRHDYSTHINNNTVHVGHDGFDILRKYSALGATHDSKDRFDPPKCDADTRVAIIKDIIAWAKITESPSSMLWLRGSAGVGKSALAQSVAELCCGDGCFAGGFFFSRTADNRSDGRLLIPTLVYQLISYIPETRPLVKKIINRDPSILERSLETQMQVLFVEPLNHVGQSLFKKLFDRPRPQLIVVDGLDECSDREVQCNLLKILSDSLQSLHFPLRMLITSRPEIHITHSFKHHLPAFPYVRTFDLSEDSCAESDIYTFLWKRFTEIKQTHPFPSYIPESWPTNENIAELVRRSSGQFIYASTVIKYISSAKHKPVKRLEVILRLSHRPINDTPYAELDALYIHILSSVQVEDIEPVLKILGILFIQRTIDDNFGDCSSPTSLERLLSLQPGDVEYYLADLASVLTVTSPNVPIRMLHKSLADFLLDPTRAEIFYRDPRLSHSFLASGFMKYVLPSNFSLVDALLHQENDPYCFSHWDSTVAHLKKAVQTEDLKRDFINLIQAYPQSHFQFQRQKHRKLSLAEMPDLLDFSWSWIISLFRCLEEANIFNSMHAYVLYEFDEYHRQHVIHYTAHPELAQSHMLTLLVFCYDCYDPSGTLVPDLPSHVSRFWELQDEGHDQSLRTFDEDKLNIGNLLELSRLSDYSADTKHRHIYRLRYMKKLCEFLLNPDRSRECCVDGAKYAQCALECLKPMCGPRPRDGLRLTFLSTAERPVSGKTAVDQRSADLVFITLATALLPRALVTTDLSSFLIRNGIYNSLLESFQDEVEKLISAMKDCVQR